MTHNLLHIALQIVLSASGQPNTTSEIRAGIWDVHTVVSERSDLLLEGDTELSMRVLTVMSYYESQFKSDAVNVCDRPTYGVMQIDPMWAPLPILLDRKGNLIVGLGLIKFLSAKCGLGVVRTGWLRANST